MANEKLFVSKDLLKYQMKQIIKSFKERIGMKMLSEEDYEALDAVDHVMPETSETSILRCGAQGGTGLVWRRLTRGARFENRPSRSEA